MPMEGTTRENPLVTDITLGLVETLKNINGVQDVSVVVRSPVERASLVTWEQRHNVSLPVQLRCFYATTDGFCLTWNYSTAGKVLALGNLEVHPLARLNRLSTGKSSGDAFAPSITDLALAEDFIGGPTDIKKRTHPQEQPSFHASKMYEIDNCQGYGRMVIAYPGRGEHFPEGSYWFVDLALRIHFISLDTTTYWRLMLAHLGMPQWELLVSGLGLSPWAKNDIPLVDYAFYSFDNDTIQPTCDVFGTADCSTYNHSAVCGDGSYTVTVEFEDDESGLYQVEANPNGTVEIISNFSPGTTDPVTMDYTNLCCVMQVSFTDVDGAGNSASCGLDLGLLQGLVIDLKASEVGYSWINLQWTLTSSEMYPLHKYSLLMDDDLTTQFIENDCPTYCNHNVTNLAACSTHSFVLTPVFMVSTQERDGLPASLSAGTAESVPDRPTGLVISSLTNSSATVSWDPPTSLCSAMFEICYSEVGQSPMTAKEAICGRTADLSYTLTNISGCTTYSVSVKAVTQGGLYSEPEFVNFDSLVLGTSAATNPLAVAESNDTVLFSWDDPLENPNCVDRFILSYEVIQDATVVKETLSTPPGEHYAEFHPLQPCTNYTFMVEPLSFDGSLGPIASDIEATKYNDPPSVTGIFVSQITETSAVVTWSIILSPCTDFYTVCVNDDYHPVQTCQHVASTSVQLTDLYPCSHYTVYVYARNKADLHSKPMTSNFQTNDVVPGAPENVTVTETTPTSIVVTFEPPATNPQCAAHYETDVQLKGSSKFARGLQASRSSSNSEQFSGLEPCRDYIIRLRTMSPAGLSSEWVEVEAETGETTPSQPQNLHYVSGTINSVLMQWFRPATAGYCVDSYRISWSDSSSGANGTDTVISSESMIVYTIAGVPPCTTYDVQVTALTDIGLSSSPASSTGSSSCE